MKNLDQTQPSPLSHEFFVKQVNGSLVGELFHQHTLIKAFVKNPPKETTILNNWLEELVRKIGMKIVIGPFSHYVSACGNSGLTGGVIIETSHCSIHVWDEPSPAMIQFDVYSCSHYETAIIIDHLNVFGLVSYELLAIDRNEDLKVIDHRVVTLNNNY